MGWSWTIIIIQIPFSGHLRYDRLKQNLKYNNFSNSILEALSDNIEGNIPSSLINVCHYIAEHYEDEFVSAAGDSGLTFLVQCLLLRLRLFDK